jgi:hypothetical protein
LIISTNVSLEGVTTPPSSPEATSEVAKVINKHEKVSLNKKTYSIQTFN